MFLRSCPGEANRFRIELGPMSSTDFKPDKRLNRAISANPGCEQIFVDAAPALAALVWNLRSSRLPQTADLGVFRGRS